MSEYKLTNNKFRLALDLDPELGEQVEALANKEDRPLGNMARVLLREAMKARADHIVSLRREA